MITKNYATLKGLLDQTLYGEMNFNEFHRNKFYHKTLGWIKFTLPEDEENKGYEMFANVIYERCGKSKMWRLRSYNGHDHGILNRLSLNLSRNRAEYCAGQDYESEIRVIQRIFRDEN